MKIGIVCYPTFGGSGVVATELGLELSKRGHEVHFITYNQPVRLELISNNVHYHEVNVPEYPLFHYQPYELALSSKLVDTVKLHKIEILHVHYAIPHAYAAYMAKKMLREEGIFVPIVTTLHGTDITLVGSHPFYKPAVTFSINKSDAVTAVSESLKNDTTRLFNIKRDIHVVPNFIDLEKYHDNFTDCQRSMMAKPEERIITHISNLRPVKRVQDVISVFNNIQKEMPAKLMLVGEGPEREAIELRCQELGILDKVIFFGKSNEIDKILCYSDLFLLPSEAESFGLAALEAMSSSVPVISSNAGGISEVNKHGITGFLSNVGDVDDMTKNALYILKDEARLNTFKENARAEAKKFDLHAIVPQYEAIYQDTLKQCLVL
ncbi:N-acetyl-alpha-D-glucosaminyl L-malate synthase BshA [Neotamlana laminarinivorans]|uniref:N-acetyl-alpha-D-glucosaminyl L-malate synthase BshA n=1 Tax=Neotamlana laminarinivorans TaxID=2883124 RepID=A0A9X1HWM3_9FLAO|nr:N-acetyl-alpha-D-glucosaminyl L-malate synthase BshA [Tamlana laminarinivorans]MCB4797528.1 N-acetyl-alpha-D-glucosaminyl L-malate synthase BshA [Tamlana laminarinivorans]